MKRPVKKKRHHTKPIPIDEDQIYEMAKIHCTNEEIATILGCSVDTITRRFADLLAKGRSEGKSNLRRMQFERCKRGSDTMLIHMGKNLLDQREKTEVISENINHNSEATKEELDAARRARDLESDFRNNKRSLE